MTRKENVLSGCFYTMKNSFMCIHKRLFIALVLCSVGVVESDAQPRYEADSLKRRENWSRAQYLHDFDLAMRGVQEVSMEGSSLEGAPSSPNRDLLQKYENLADSMTRFPAIIDLGVAQKIIDIDPFRIRRMFFFHYDVVLDYNIYDFPSAENEKIVAVLEEAYGKQYRRGRLPKVLVTTNTPADKYRYGQQIQYYLRSIGTNGSVRGAVDELIQKPELPDALYQSQLEKGQTLDFEKAAGLKPGQAPPGMDGKGKGQAAPAKGPSKKKKQVIF
jgi:hypothetical protein